VGKIGGGQSAAIKRCQKLSTPGGIGARCATSLRNTGLLHGRVFITARWQLIGGRRFTAYTDAPRIAVLAPATRNPFTLDATRFTLC
jgi:hypothetical protein